MQKVRIKLIKSKGFVEIMNKPLTSLKQRNNKNEIFLNAQEIVRSETRRFYSDNYYLLEVKSGLLTL